MKHTVLASILLLLLSQISWAQKEEKLETEWLAKDVESAKLIARLMPLESQTFETIKSILDVNTAVDDDDLGFGGRRFNLGKGNGYTSFYVDAFTFGGSFGYYEIGIRGGSDDWPRIREQVIKMWRQSNGPEFEETDSGLTYRVRHNSVFQAYENAVGLALGDMKPVDVPSSLKEHYDYLISPMINSYVGRGTCGYGGSTLEGRLAIDALVEAERIDLIENVLRGFNPGGRVYAALALLEMKKRGIKLSKETQDVINKIAALKIRISTCAGCIVTGRTAGEILRSPDEL